MNTITNDVAPEGHNDPSEDIADTAADENVSTNAATFVPQQLPRDKYLSEAQGAYGMAKNGAMKAAANAYMLYRLCAHTDYDREWLTKQIAERNKAIKAYNADIATRQKDAATYRDAKVNDPNAVASAQVLADERLSKAEWAELKKVSIDQKAGAGGFTSICKFVFEFDRPFHASKVSRYSAALAWLHKEFRTQLVRDPQTLVDAMANAGGFEAVVSKRVTADDSSLNVSDAKVIDAEIQKRIAEAVNKAKAAGTVTLAPTHATGGLVVMVGRRVGGNIDVVSDIPLDEAAINNVLRYLDNAAMLPTKPETEFMSRVLNIGQLVNARGKSPSAPKDAEAGQLAPEQKLLTIVPDGKAAKFVISSRHVTSSVVVHAWPGKVVSPNLTATTGPMAMKAGNLKFLEEQLRQRSSRLLQTLSMDSSPLKKDGTPAESMASWTLENEALVAAELDTAARKLYWTDMIKMERKPLDVDHFDSQFAVTVNLEHLTKIYEGLLVKFKTDAAQSKADGLLNLLIDPDRIVARYKGQDEVPVDFATGASRIFSLQFRPADLHGLVLKLTQLAVPDVVLSGNESGILKVSWSDDYGAYAVFLPTSSDGKDLNGKFLSIMDPKVADTLAGTVDIAA